MGWVALGALTAFMILWLLWMIKEDNDDGEY